MVQQTETDGSDGQTGKEELAKKLPYYIRRKMLDGRDVAIGLDSCNQVSIITGHSVREGRATKVIEQHIEDIFDIEQLPELVDGHEEMVVDAALDQLDDGEAQTETIEVGDSVYSEEIEDWTELFAADGDKFGDVRHALYEASDGTYVHVSYRPGELAQRRDGTVTQAYSVKQVGEDISTSVIGADDIKDECIEFVVGDWDVFGVRWTGQRISVETYREDWPDAVFDSADGGDVTFDILLE